MSNEDSHEENGMKAGEGFHLTPHHRTGHRPHPAPSYFPIDPNADQPPAPPPPPQP